MVESLLLSLNLLGTHEKQNTRDWVGCGRHVVIIWFKLMNKVGLSDVSWFTKHSDWNYKST